MGCLAEIFPLTHFLRIVRGFILRDAAPVVMARVLWPLLGLLVATITLAALSFRKKLDEFLLKTARLVSRRSSPV